MMTDDMELVRDYAARQSELAFETLVARYVKLVYWAALRQVHDSHLAEDVTQTVFIILARKARSLGPKTILASWLYQTARLTAANYRRTELRRARREKEALMQSVLKESHPEPDETWQRISPLLEDVVGRLGERDRHAIVLRFFENKTLDEVGAALGVSEDAAKMRVNRALEKLRKVFVKRGVTLPAAAIAGAVSANSVQAAPIHLGVSVTTVSLGKVAVSGSASLLLRVTLQKLLWLKLRTALVVVLGLSLIGAGLTIRQRRHNSGFSSSATIRLPAQNNAGQGVAAGPAVIKIKLFGTPGLPFEVRYSANGAVQTTKGVLPNEVSFTADAFSATINVKGPGEFGYQVYRGDLQLSSASVARITNTRTDSIERNSGGGISVRGKPN